MKLVKRVLSAIAAVVLSVGLTAGTVFAAPSATGNLPSAVNTGNTADHYIISRIIGSGSYTRIARYAPRVKTLFDDVENAVNNGESAKSAMQTLVDGLKAIVNASDSEAPESVRTSAQNILNQIQSTKEPLTSFFDIDKTGDNVPKSKSGNYLVTLKVPTITTRTKGIVVLHFNEDTQEWELISPQSTDLENQEITIELTSLGATMILCDADTGNGVITVNGKTTSGQSGLSVKSGSTKSGKSPKTSDRSVNWTGYATAAVILAGASVFALRKKKVK